MSVSTTLDQLTPTFSGQVLQPSDPGDNEARRVHNVLIDRRPAIIAPCFGTADVADAVKLARSNNLEIAVRGGGHNVAGRGTIDDGLMIDLVPMKGIRRSLWRDIPHHDPAATVAGTLFVAMSADGSKFVYGLQKHQSELYLAEGLR